MRGRDNERDATIDAGLRRTPKRKWLQLGVPAHVPGNPGGRVLGVQGYPKNKKHRAGKNPNSVLNPFTLFRFILKLLVCSIASLKVDEKSNIVLSSDLNYSMTITISTMLGKTYLCRYVFIMEIRSGKLSETLRPISDVILLKLIIVVNNIINQ